MARRRLREIERDSTLGLSLSFPYVCMKTVEELIDLLPETIFFHGQREKAFLEITSGHVYYCTNHSNRGSLSCAFVSCRGKGNLRESLEEAYKWIQDGIDSGDILAL